MKQGSEVDNEIERRLVCEGRSRNRHSQHVVATFVRVEIAWDLPTGKPSEWKWCWLASAATQVNDITQGPVPLDGSFLPGALQVIHSEMTDADRQVVVRAPGGRWGTRLFHRASGCRLDITVPAQNMISLLDAAAGTGVSLPTLGEVIATITR